MPKLWIFNTELGHGEYIDNTEEPVFSAFAKKNEALHDVVRFASELTKLAADVPWTFKESIIKDLKGAVDRLEELNGDYM